MCGEHGDRGAGKSFGVGSSPHVRGALDGNVYVCVFPRIIPACAGSTSVHCYMPMPSGDHPRMCGEHCYMSYKGASALGSSPHVRGALFIANAFSMVNRIIPACAGSTWLYHGGKYASKDHPRMCGEHLSASFLV